MSKTLRQQVDKGESGRVSLPRSIALQRVFPRLRQTGKGEEVNAQESVV
jgi:hypothetical protein